MKRLSIILAALLCVVLAAVKVSAGTGGANEVEMVREFYQQYAVAFSISDYNQRIAKCDSLLKNYCSETICKNTRDDRGVNGLHYDYATDDAGIDASSVKTLEVKVQDNGYSVTYKRNAKDDHNREYTKNVKLKVGMKDGKINTVKAME